MHDWGISMGYHDVAGHWREVSPGTLTAVRQAMGAGDDANGHAPPGTSPHDDPVVAFRPGRAPAAAIAGGPWELHTEDGATISLDSGAVGSDAHLPPDLPLGYHRLRRIGDGRERLLIVSPGRCHLPPDLRTWGWAAQLYATRSRQSWGMGDLGDLRRLAQWSQRLGAGMCLLNPLHATVPDFPQASPYYPSSRCFRNPLYLRIEDVPGAGEAMGTRGMGGVPPTTAAGAARERPRRPPGSGRGPRPARSRRRPGSRPPCRRTARRTYAATPPPAPPRRPRWRRDNPSRPPPGPWRRRAGPAGRPRPPRGSGRGGRWGGGWAEPIRRSRWSSLENDTVPEVRSCFWKSVRGDRLTNVKG